MRRVGTVTGVAGGLVVVRSDGDPPTLGTGLVGEDLDALGEVVEVFGPVDRPYVAVAPEGDPPATLLDGPVYER
jgi:RNA-binding protein